MNKNIKKIINDRTVEYNFKEIKESSCLYCWLCVCDYGILLKPGRTRKNYHDRLYNYYKSWCDKLGLLLITIMPYFLIEFSDDSYLNEDEAKLQNLLKDYKLIKNQDGKIEQYYAPDAYKIIEMLNPNEFFKGNIIYAHKINVKKYISAQFIKNDNIFIKYFYLCEIKF